jgi:hypothetical protein
MMRRLSVSMLASTSLFVACGPSESDNVVSEGAEEFCAAPVAPDMVGNTRDCGNAFTPGVYDAINSSTDIDWYYIINDGVTHLNSKFSLKAPPSIGIRCAVYQNNDLSPLASSSASPSSECKVVFQTTGTNRYNLRVWLNGSTFPPEAAMQTVALYYQAHEYRDEFASTLEQSFDLWLDYNGFQYIDGALQSSRDVDMFNFHTLSSDIGAQSSMYTIAVHGTGATPLSMPMLSVIDETGRVVASSEKMDNYTTQLSVELTTGTKYHVAVDNADGVSKGQYLLEIQKDYDVAQTFTFGGK